MPGRTLEAWPHGHAHWTWHARPRHSCMMQWEVSLGVCEASVVVRDLAIQTATITADNACFSKSMARGRAAMVADSRSASIVLRQQVPDSMVTWDDSCFQTVLTWSWWETRATRGSTWEGRGAAMGATRTHALWRPASLKRRARQWHVAACIAPPECCSSCQQRRHTTCTDRVP